MTPQPPPKDLFQHRLLFVTGKGGVGKTTVAAALGLAAAQAGMRVILCELDARERMGQLFGESTRGFEEVEVAPDMSAIAIDPQHAIEEYMLLQIRVRPVYDMLFKNRIFDYFAAATPGLSELVTIGKVWELAQPHRLTKGAPEYDLVIVDAPATGHGLAMLEAPTTFQRIARVGPIHRQAGHIQSFLHDPDKTAIVAVATAEEMPVNETLDLREALQDRLSLDLDMAIVNALEPVLFTDEEIKTLAAVDGDLAPIDAAINQHKRANCQQEQLKRLEADLGRPLAKLPFLYEKSIGRAELAQLAEILAEELAVPLAEATRG
ncbi:MAG TPA: ArsA family ATPase [Solirubrobacterales bacterium]|nr:ArsA family ATPase [Solirubrobacterales bacterium]